MTTRRWQPGEPCTIHLRGDRGIIERELAATVHFVDANGRPLAVCRYDGIIDGFVDWLPLIWTGDGGWAETFAGTVVEITERRAEP